MALSGSSPRHRKPCEVTTDNGSISVVVHDGDRTTISALNSTAHLEGTDG